MSKRGLRDPEDPRFDQSQEEKREVNFCIAGTCFILFMEGFGNKIQLSFSVSCYHSTYQPCITLLSIYHINYSQFENFCNKKSKKRNKQKSFSSSTSTIIIIITQVNGYHEATPTFLLLQLITSTFKI